MAQKRSPKTLATVDRQAAEARPTPANAAAPAGNAPRQEMPPTPDRDRRLPLKTAQHVRSELARVYRSMRHGDIDPAIGTKLTYVLVALGKMIEVGDLEKRIEALEVTARQT